MKGPVLILYPALSSQPCLLHVPVFFKVFSPDEQDPGFWFAFFIVQQGEVDKVILHGNGRVDIAKHRDVLHLLFQAV